MVFVICIFSLLIVTLALLKGPINSAVHLSVHFSACLSICPFVCNTVFSGLAFYIFLVFFMNIEFKKHTKVMRSIFLRKNIIVRKIE